MDDFLLFIEGAKGVKDYVIFIQVPHSKWALAMAEAMAYHGLLALIGSKVERIHVSRQFDYPHARHAHYTFTVQGKRGDAKCPDFFLYAQLPKHENSDKAAESMVEEGLATSLGVYQKRVTIKRAGETLPDKGEEIGEIQVN